MEAKSCKKSTDTGKMKNTTIKAKTKVQTPVTLPLVTNNLAQILDLQHIRQDAVLQAQVEKRLKQLTDNDKAGTKLTSLMVCLVRSS